MARRKRPAVGEWYRPAGSNSWGNKMAAMQRNMTIRSANFWFASGALRERHPLYRQRLEYKPKVRPMSNKRQVRSSISNESE